MDELLILIMAKDVHGSMQSHIQGMPYHVKMEMSHKVKICFGSRSYCATWLFRSKQKQFLVFENRLAYYIVLGLILQTH